MTLNPSTQKFDLSGTQIFIQVIDREYELEMGYLQDVQWMQKESGQKCDFMPRMSSIKV